MSGIKTTITEQLQQLQQLMHRASFHGFLSNGRMHNPHRGQGRVLSILKMKPVISQKELTFLLGMSKQSLAELLAKLEKSGYITREPSEEDKRVLMVRLTEAGQNATFADGDSDAADEEEILNCLNDIELEMFSDCLGRVITRYEERFPKEDYGERREHMKEFMSFYGRDFAYGHGGPFEGPHGGPHGGHHGGHHDDPHGPHNDPHGNYHDGPHCDPHGGPHGDPHCDPHGDPHGGPHGGPHRKFHGQHHGPHHGPHDPHGNHHEGPHCDPHGGPHGDPHDSHHGPHDDPHGNHHGWHDDPHDNHHRGPHYALMPFGFAFSFAF
ncbi:MAG: MarR family transcriptional regulator [Clostridiales bacterium]|nr:MarR family transcriptional regulator [Clostridiales bacterium]